MHGLKAAGSVVFASAGLGVISLIIAGATLDAHNSVGIGILVTLTAGNAVLGLGLRPAAGLTAVIAVGFTLAMLVRAGPESAAVNGFWSAMAAVIGLLTTNQRERLERSDFLRGRELAAAWKTTDSLLLDGCRPILSSQSARPPLKVCHA